MILTAFSYITIPTFTGDIKADVKNLFAANNKMKISNHVEACVRSLRRSLA